MAKLQRYEEKDELIRSAFKTLKKEHPERLNQKIEVAFCSQVFGLESVTDSIERLAKLGYEYIEVPGNYGGPDIGNHTKTKEILEALQDTGMKCSGVCPYTFENFSLHAYDYPGKQAAVDYFRSNVQFCKDLGGTYYLITPASLPSPLQLDGGDWDRSVLLLRQCADILVENNVQGAVESIKGYLTSIVHSFSEAEQYIQDVNHPGVQHIYGDLDHMWHGEEHIGQAILDYGDRILNLHLRDTLNGLPIGHGMIDVDTVIRALYLVGFNQPGHYVVGEPLPIGFEPDTSGSIFRKYSEETRVALAKDTIDYFREREKAVLQSD